VTFAGSEQIPLASKRLQSERWNGEKDDH